MIRSIVSSFRRSGRGASSRSDKSDNTHRTPLLDDDTSDSGSDGSDDSSTAASYEYEGVPKEKPSAFQLAKIAVVNVVLVGGVAASVAAMLPSALLLSPSIMVCIAGAITIANAPYSAFKEVRVARIPTMRALNDKLRDEAHRLEREMDALSEEVDAIAPEAERAGAVEDELREIADQQNFNLDRLIDLVNENEEILDQMRDNLRQKVAQDIIRIVIKSDINNDQKFCKVEGKVLALKIRIQLQEYGVEFDEMKFYSVLNECPTVPRVVAIVQKLIPGLGQDDDSAGVSDNDEDGDRDNQDRFRFLTSDKFLRMSGSLQDVPEARQAPSALVKCSSWRDAVGTSVAGGSAGGSRQMSETKQVILALSSSPSRRRHTKRNSRSSKDDTLPQPQQQS